jgi:septum formation protein
MATTKMCNIILASTSSIRRKILFDAGIEHEAISPAIDEAAEKAKLYQKNPNFTPVELAQALSMLKAKSLDLPGRLIIGADQILSLENQSFEKPKNIDEAKTHLQILRGKTHTLETTISCVKNGVEIWTYVSQPKLTMRNFNDDFLNNYIDQAGTTLLTSVGAYKLEKEGIQLFEKIEGDYFSILGLPILPLLSFLRSEGVIS